MTTEPTRQEMIDKINEVIADKTLNAGCKIIFKNIPSFQKDKILRHFTMKITTIIAVAKYDQGRLFFVEDENYGTFKMREDYFEDIYEEYDYEQLKNLIYTIIGHPVMIGDVFDRIKHINVQPTLEIYNGIIRKWSEFRKPIEDQSEECIRFIYNLCN